MNTQEKFKLANGNDPKGVQHTENFTMNEFILREQAALPKGKKSLFYLLIVLTVLWGLVKIPFSTPLKLYKLLKDKLG